MFKRVLIANRGEIACRIIRSLHTLGCEAVAVYSEEDVHAMHVQQADHAILLGPAAASESYLNFEKVLAAARDSGAEAIHPGYGFLSENAAFAEACEAQGLAFIGPTPGNIRAFGLKHKAREIAERVGVPLLPGTGLLSDAQEALAGAAKLGYPVMLKSVAGGGGIGLQRCDTPAELEEKLEAVQRLSQANFGQSGVFLEKFIVNARHIEAQLFGDGMGQVVVLGERDCSTQRRNQKVIEETPAPHLTPETRQSLLDAARKMGEAVNYRSAGTVEFVCDADTGAFYFLEVNTRLQVEHGVTELVTGVDLVEWMVRLAAGESIDFSAVSQQPKGWAIQARIYAEDANKKFQPSSGRLIHVRFPEGVRCDRWIDSGTEVSPYYDPLLAKLLVHAENREDAVQAMGEALRDTRLDGIETNLAFLRSVVASVPFREGIMTTGSLAKMPFQPRSLDILHPGIATTIQDYPGRIGYWMPGIPPSGPMDSLSFRIGNRLLGNPEGAPGLELAYSGPKIRFNAAMRVCLTGAVCDARLDGKTIPLHQVIEVEAGSQLHVGRIAAGAPGCRAYLLFEGGLDVPLTLGSASTFAIGNLGGHAGRPLRAGDVIHVAAPNDQAEACVPLLQPSAPVIPEEMQIGVLYGPHAAPDFFQWEDIEALLSHPWEVHHNSDRTGVRLIGPKPKWARKDGGEAGLHPSNIHDTMYAVGAIDFTGDMPIILGVDGPSQGGFCCPVVIASAELWKVGQLRAGMKVRFHIISNEEAIALQSTQDVMLAGVTKCDSPAPHPASHEVRSLSDVLARLPAQGETPEVTYRMAGDRTILVEYGPMRLDLVYRFRVQALLERLEREGIVGVVELCPAVRSLQVIFDNRILNQGDLLQQLMVIERDLPSIDHLVIKSRLVKLPLAWNDPQAVLAMTKYSQVRDGAPWCPDNIEFIRRVNGLDSQEAVRAIVYGGTYLVLGLGNVYLGAPCTTPLDPRHRLVTTKYNPARTWTPENAVGIGGAYLGIYGMEGPGGYQLVGRTCQMFNRHHITRDFPVGHPWLLNAFDQIQFYSVSSEELGKIRDELLQGTHKLEVEEVEFHPAAYLAYLESIREETTAFEQKRAAAFQAEREHWEAIGEFSAQKQAVEVGMPKTGEAPVLDPGQAEVVADMTANVWKVMVERGAQVHEGEVLFILEAMKMELPVLAPCSGFVSQILCEAGKLVAPGQRLAVIDAQPRTSEA